MVLFDFIDDDDIQRQRRLRQVLLMVLLLQFHNNIRDRHILSRSAIVQPIESPWKRLYERGDDESFFHLTGLNRRAFRMLMEYIFDLDEFTRRRRGRPRLLGPDGYLGLVLFYMGSTMTNKHLCLIFGTTPSVCSRAINWMLKKIVRALRDHPFARVKFPDREKMREYAAMVQLREPLVDDIIGFMDGVSFPAECTDDRFIQNAMYCGYDCDTMVNNVFAYGPDGKVFFAAINFPGSWADGSLTARFLHQMKRRMLDYKICVDQGFPRSGDAYGTFVGPITKRAARRLHRDVRDYLLLISNVHTSLRQASEWGMRGLQGTFPRCKKRMPSDSALRRLVIEAIVLVHNYRTELIGYSQIQTVFDPEYVRCENLQGYDRISQYYFRPGEYDSEIDGDGNESDGGSNAE